MAKIIKVASMEDIQKINGELVQFLKDKGILDIENKNFNKIKLILEVDKPIRVKARYETTGKYYKDRI